MHNGFVHFSLAYMQCMTDKGPAIIYGRGGGSGSKVGGIEHFLVPRRGRGMYEGTDAHVSFRVMVITPLEIRKINTENTENMENTGNTEFSAEIDRVFCIFRNFPYFPYIGWGDDHGWSFRGWAHVFPPPPPHANNEDSLTVSPSIPIWMNRES